MITLQRKRIDDLSDFWKKLYEIEVSEGMLVLGKVDRIEEHGVYIDLHLIEAEAYCPVKELSSRRVTTPKDIVHQNQQIVGKIYRVRRGGQVLSISLKRVTNEEREEKREDGKKLRRTFSIFRKLEDNLDLEMDELIEKLGKPLLRYFKTVYDGLKEILVGGKDLLQELKVPDEYIDPIYMILEESIKVSVRELKREITIKTLSPNGIEEIKTALKNAKEVSPRNIEIRYLSAPRYSVKVKAFRWKDATKRFEKFMDRLEEEMGSIPSKWNPTVQVQETKG